MNRDDFVKLAGVAVEEGQSVPVAFLLINGYACAGYYHPAVNEGLASTCVLLNARLIELQGPQSNGNRPSIQDFNEFLQEIVTGLCESDEHELPSPSGDAYGKSVPLMAIPFEQVTVVYPVAHISALMRRAEKKPNQKSSFLDIDRSEVVRLLRTRLW